jgi:hypothetical protein
MNALGPFRLVHDTARRLACQAIMSAEQGMVVTLRPPTRNLEQNALLHAALTDIAEQVTWHGQRFDVETWKRLHMAMFLRTKGEAAKLIPALDGKGFDVVQVHTSTLNKRDFSDLCESVFAFGAENGVTFREPRK